MNNPNQITLELTNEQTADLVFMEGYQAGVQDTLNRLKQRQVNLLLTRQKQSPVQSSQEKKNDVAANDVASTQAAAATANGTVAESAAATA